MRRRVQVAVILLLGLLVWGVVIVAINRVRHSANRMVCVHHLKQMGGALHNYASTYDDAFPSGTVSNADLPPDKRLSWLTEIYPAYMVSGPFTRFDRAKAWDSAENCPVYGRIHHDPPEEDELVVLSGKDIFLNCPINFARSTHPLPSLTHYIGVAGVGDDAATLPLSHHRAGFFGYDRKITARNIIDGLSTTMAVAEVLEGGPWTAGGKATVRGLEANDVPYFGEGGQFASHHRTGHNLALSWPITTNVLFADGSVRWVTSSISPRVFEAMATIAGGEEVEMLDDR